MILKSKFRVFLCFVLFLAIVACATWPAFAAGPVSKANESYRVLAPIESGNLLLFPVVRSGNRPAGEQNFLTLDEGIKSGQVEVTEAGKAQGLVRPRGGSIRDAHRLRGDQVNTLVLINHSDQPLLLLAGEIVTGGKQDRVIAKDRIVPPGSEPIDLSVFCIEPGRWVESSAKFGGTAKASSGSFMVQPTVRRQAMVSKDQQQVWNAVGGAISTMSAAAAPMSGRPMEGTMINSPLATTSYAKVMQQDAVSAKVDEAAASMTKTRDQVIATLRQEHAVGVVVAVRGEIVWADIFSETDLLSRYWTKLVRSYAAESLTVGESHAAPTIADAEHFLNQHAGGTETSTGEVDTYRYSEIKSDTTDTFVLESLLASASYEVHISKLKLTLPKNPVQIGVIY